MAVVAYVRHGKRDSTPETIFRDGSPGTIPCSLTSEGVEQAHHAGRQLSGFNIQGVASSPLLRAFYTGDIIRYEYFKATGKSLDIEFEPLLIERQVGKLNNGPVPGGVPWVEFRNGQAEKGYPDIEAFDSIKGRVVKFAEKLFELDRSGDGLVVATTHQDTVHAAIAQALGYDELNAAFNPGVKDASITVIFYNKSGGSKLNAEVIAQGEVDLSKAQSREISRLIRS